MLNRLLNIFSHQLIFEKPPHKTVKTAYFNIYYQNIEPFQEIFLMEFLVRGVSPRPIIGSHDQKTKSSIRKPSPTDIILISLPKPAQLD